MARKRYKTERMDYRKGGRVTYAKGGRGAKPIKGNRSKPKPKNYGSKDEYQIALQQYRDSRPAATAPAVTPPAPVTQPVRVGDKVTRPQNEYRAGSEEADTGVPANLPSTNNSSVYNASSPYVAPSTTVSDEEPDISGGSDGANNPDGGVGASGAVNKEVLTPGVNTDIGTGNADNIVAVAKSNAAANAANTAAAEKAAAIVKDKVTLAKEATAEAGIIDAAKQVGFKTDSKGDYILDENGKPIPLADDTATTIGAGTKAVAGVADDVTIDATTTGTSDAAETQAPITAATVDPTLVGAGATVDAATGTISEDAIAQAAQVEAPLLIEGADVKIKEGALAARVTGTISPQAKAVAAQAAGTTLSKVTRAKKQLRNAGVSEADIAELGNDPEALEDRLMDFTETERGVIGDLPEEALVSNQIDSLLKGMESGEIPTWASPAVAAVEQMLARRGLSASTVGRDNLFNAIIQSAVPIAQSNAQAIQASVAQTRDIEAREELANTQMRQQTALQNAGNVFQMDMAQFSADQQTNLSNSKFMQTVSLTEASNDQQAAIQNAILATQVNMQNATLLQSARSQNAKSFLTMDMANLSNKQQANVVTAQFQNQVLLSDQAASNAAKQFNSASENQTNQFMASLAQQVELSNADRADRMTISNNAATNARAAAQAGIQADLNKTNAALVTDINKANAELEYRRDAFNATNSAAVKASNITWRRNANTINTAAANTIAMQNTMNAFNLGTAELAYLWQEARDTASHVYQSKERGLDRDNALKLQILVNDANAAVNAAGNQNTNRRDFYGRILDIWPGSGSGGSGSSGSKVPKVTSNTGSGVVIK